MAEKQRKDPGQESAVALRELPPGITLRQTLRGHKEWIGRIAWSPDGRVIASPSGEGVVALWEAETGRQVHALEWDGSARARGVAFDPSGRLLAACGGSGGGGAVAVFEAETGRRARALEWDRNLRAYGVAFDPSGRFLAACGGVGGGGGTVAVFETETGRRVHALEWDRNIEAYAVTFDPSGRLLAACGGVGGVDIGAVAVFETETGRRVHALEWDRNVAAFGVAFDPSGRFLAACGGVIGVGVGAVAVFEAETGRRVRTLEGHTALVTDVSFSADGKVLASRGYKGDDTVRLWRTDDGEPIAIIANPASDFGLAGLVFHPRLSLLASVGSVANASEERGDTLVYVWELDLAVLLGSTGAARTVPAAVHHTTAKIVLVGDHSVGKSGLGYRLVHRRFKKQASTHGQQFWVFPECGAHRADGTECEAILWDLAGQPDYRLTHALFLDDADLALVLFDSSDRRDPLHGVNYWLRQLQVARGGCPILLVGAQADRGTPTLTSEELKAFCEQNGIAGHIRTSALTGEGLDELVGRMKELIPWDKKPETVTTVTFKRIKDHVLGLKETETGRRVIVTPEELRERLEATDAGWEFSDAEMLTAVGHLENYGYVKRLRTSKGETRILLAPDLLNNLASSFVLDARRNPKGLGSLEEERLLAGGYEFPELKGLSTEERDILIDAAALLFLEHNVCFRETDHLASRSYLVFPELINLKKPAVENEPPTEDGATYTVSGAAENVYASLVVLLGYTPTFTRTNQWQNHARYEVGGGRVCGFRQDADRDGELDFVLYFGTNVDPPVRTLFQGLFESFLARRNLQVLRYEPVACPKCRGSLNRAVVREKIQSGKEFTFCNDCGERLTLPKAGEPIRLTDREQTKVDQERRVAGERSRFEQAIFRLKAYVESQKVRPPECFVSYAWGDPEQERWIEKTLAADLQKAGLTVVLDRWENARVGASIMRFVERIDECDRMIVVGTPLYRAKAKNVASESGSAVAAEWDLAGIRLLGTESQKSEVLPILLDGTPQEALPPLLRGRVRADFRNPQDYFRNVFDLILSLYGIPTNDPAVADLRESLQGRTHKA